VSSEAGRSWCVDLFDPEAFPDPCEDGLVVGPDNPERAIDRGKGNGGLTLAVVAEEGSVDHLLDGR
jgi:hypothetical protein